MCVFVATTPYRLTTRWGADWVRFEIPADVAVEEVRRRVRFVPSARAAPPIATIIDQLDGAARVGGQQRPHFDARLNPFGWTNFGRFAYGRIAGGVGDRCRYGVRSTTPVYRWIDLQLPCHSRSAHDDNTAARNGVAGPSTSLRLSQEAVRHGTRRKTTVIDDTDSACHQTSPPTNWDDHQTDQ